LFGGGGSEVGVMGAFRSVCIVRVPQDLTLPKSNMHRRAELSFKYGREMADNSVLLLPSW